MLNRNKRLSKKPPVKRKNQKTLRKLALALVITVFAALLYSRLANHTQEARQKVELQNTIQQLDKTKKTLNKTLNDQKTKDTETQKKLDDTTKQLEETKKQLEAKRSTPKVYAAAVSAEPVPTNVVAGCGDNAYANYIYMHESGCNTNALNSIGCYGIGQSCPRSKIAHCGSDYACQNEWFTNYANRAYGGWQGAYEAWVRQHWW